VCQFYRSGKHVCQNSLLISQSGRHFEAEREIITEEKKKRSSIKLTGAKFFITAGFLFSQEF
jgi:hypothetical protein